LPALQKRNMQDPAMTTTWVRPGADMMNAVTGEQMNTNVIAAITAITGVTEENIIAIVTITEATERHIIAIAMITEPRLMVLQEEKRTGIEKEKVKSKK
jgi:hypothetical protein